MSSLCVVCRTETATRDATSIVHYYCSDACRQHDWKVDAPLRDVFKRTAPPQIDITSTIAVNDRGNCCACDHKTDIVCSSCKVTYYCTDRCRAQDSEHHTLLCQPFLRSIIERPDGDYIHGLHYSSKYQVPRWIWLPFDHEVFSGGDSAVCVKLTAINELIGCGDKELDCTAILDHVISGRKFDGRAITVYHHAHGDNKSINQALQAASNGQLLVCGEIVVVGEMLPRDLQLEFGARPIGTMTNEDIDMTPNDARYVLMDCKARLGRIWKGQEQSEFVEKFL